MSRVLIADDHAVARAGFKQFLEAEPGITEVGEASSGNQVLDQLRHKNWDLVLMDINMPDRSGLDVLRHVVSGYPKARVLIMSGLPEDQYARNVLRGGASGYLSKNGSCDEFLKAVRTVLMGRKYVSTSLAQTMAAELGHARTSSEPLHSQLSSREFQIFLKLASGDSVSEMANELNLSTKTVSTYRSRILEKMTFKSNADMTSYALRNGLLQ